MYFGHPRHALTLTVVRRPLSREAPNSNIQHPENMERKTSSPQPSHQEEERERDNARSRAQFGKFQKRWWGVIS
jgi:hypothetical protein